MPKPVDPPDLPPTAAEIAAAKTKAEKIAKGPPVVASTIVDPVRGTLVAIHVTGGKIAKGIHWEDQLSDTVELGDHKNPQGVYYVPG